MWEWVLLAGFCVACYSLSQPYLTWKRRRGDRMYRSCSALQEISVGGKRTVDLRDEWPLKQTQRCALSLVVPALNEEKRIGIMLYESIDFLDNFKLTHPQFSYEILVVDDGSRDATVKVALDIGRVKGVNLRVLSCAVNGGKGCAVRLGVLNAYGAKILFADADAATDIRGLEELLDQMETREDCGVAVGSRNKSRDVADISVSCTQRKRYRDILGKVFVFVVTRLCGVPVTVRSIQDTQCGFKLFTRKAALRLFPPMHLERWSFDVELLFLARRLSIPITEVQVNWHEVDGSKLNIVLDSIKIGRDVLMVRVLYFLRLWRATDVSV